MVAKKKRPRTSRRELERKHDKLVRDRERLARLEIGGDPSRPIEVDSVSIIEPRAAALSCLRCEGSTRIGAHDAVVVEGRALRRVEVECTRCGSSRVVWFAVARPAPN